MPNTKTKTTLFSGLLAMLAPLSALSREARRSVGLLFYKRESWYSVSGYALPCERRPIQACGHANREESRPKATSANAGHTVLLLRRIGL